MLSTLFYLLALALAVIGIWRSDSILLIASFYISCTTVAAIWWSAVGFPPDWHASPFICDPVIGYEPLCSSAGYLWTSTVFALFCSAVAVTPLVCACAALCLCGRRQRERG